MTIGYKTFKGSEQEALLEAKNTLPAFEFSAFARAKIAFLTRAIEAGYFPKEYAQAKTQTIKTLKMLC